MDFKDKVSVITGASSGIGQACAIALAQAGSKVVICARDVQKLNHTAGTIMELGHKVVAVQADVSKEDDCRMLINSAVEAFGGIDILINNAGMSMRATFEQVDLSVLKRLMDVNFWGTVYCTKFALPYLLKSKGTVVGISSIAGFKGLPGRTGYSASKFAMNGFLETLRIENRRKGLHVLICAPGFTASNIRNTALNSEGRAQQESPLDESRLMTSSQVADAILKAIRHRRHYLILTTLGKLTVWLNKFFPRFMDKMTYNRMAKEENSPLG